MAWRQHAAIRSHGEHFPVDKTIGTPPVPRAPLQIVQSSVANPTSLAMFFRGFGGTVSSAVVGTMCAASGPGAPGAMGTAIAVSALGAAASILLPRKVDRKR